MYHYIVSWSFRQWCAWCAEKRIFTMGDTTDRYAHFERRKTKNRKWCKGCEPAVWAVVASYSRDYDEQSSTRASYVGTAE